jgi:uncharacterized protein with FMN-binding domain
MRRVVAALVTTVAGLVILLSFKTAGSKSADRPVAISGAAAGSGSTTSQPAVSPSPSSSSSASASNKATPTPTPTKEATKTVTGSKVPVSEGFRSFGSVQVQVTLTNGKIIKLVAVDYPNGDPRSAEISQYSIPILAQEVLTAQGTTIDNVSGATYTSAAYAQSVQAALDAAKS